MRKRLITAVLCIIMLLALSMNAFAANTLTKTSTFAVRPTLKKDVISITLDGEEMILDTAPAKIDSSITSDVYVPMLSFCEGMGAKVLKWDEESQNALAVFREFAIDATAENVYITANGRCLYAEYGCKVINGVLMVQLSTLCKALDAVFEYDSENNTIEIISGAGIITSGEDFYDDEELLWLARIIWAESGNQCFEGKLAVGNVVMNRVKDESDKFPDDIYGVIFQTNQFQPTTNGSIYNNPTEDCWIAAKLALEGAKPVGDCLYFAAHTECWAGYNRTYYGQIQGHHFWL